MFICFWGTTIKHIPTYHCPEDFPEEEVLGVDFLIRIWKGTLLPFYFLSSSLVPASLSYQGTSPLNPCKLSCPRPSAGKTLFLLSTRDALIPGESLCRCYTCKHLPKTQCQLNDLGPSLPSWSPVFLGCKMEEIWAALSTPQSCGNRIRWAKGHTGEVSVNKGIQQNAGRQCCEQAQKPLKPIFSIYNWENQGAFS